jgi:hypothetical protein
MEFGDRVSIESKLVRRCPIIEGERLYVWVRSPYLCSNCIFLGYRTVRNGTVDRDEESTYFTAKEFIKVALVSPSLLLNPVYVPLDKIKLNRKSRY